MKAKRWISFVAGLCTLALLSGCKAPDIPNKPQSDDAFIPFIPLIVNAAPGQQAVTFAIRNNSAQTIVMSEALRLNRCTAPRPNDVEWEAVPRQNDAQDLAYPGDQAADVAYVDPGETTYVTYSLSAVWGDLPPGWYELVTVTTEGGRPLLTQQEFYLPDLPATAYFADVTFDKSPDMLVPLENSAYAACYDCYVWEEEAAQFVASPTFSIRNPAPDEAASQIRSHWSGDQISSYCLYVYDKGTKKFRCTNALYFEPADTEGYCRLVENAYAPDGSGTTVQDTLVKGAAYDLDRTDPLAAPYFQEGSLWDLDSQKWNSPFGSR